MFATSMTVLLMPYRTTPSTIIMATMPTMKGVPHRLLLGMKGTFSELELSILRQRSQEALRLKAARGDLHTSVAIGYVRSTDDRLEIDPDKRVREALHLAFRKFAEFGSVRQVSMWLCDEGLKMPIVVYGPAGRMVQWQLPRYTTIHRLLTNPIPIFSQPGHAPRGRLRQPHWAATAEATASARQQHLSR